ncbi:MAG: hypothetical protein AAGF92_17740 [Myxococcota bacterium]
MAAHPTLCWRGFERLTPWGDTSPRELAQLRRETMKRPERVLWAAAWIDRWLEPVDLGGERPLMSSYGLKHLAELEHPGGYVGNGELILGALALGWPVERIEDGPNAWIGVSVRSVKAVQKRLRRGAA